MLVFVDSKHPDSKEPTTAMDLAASSEPVTRSIPSATAACAADRRGEGQGAKCCDCTCDLLPGESSRCVDCWREFMADRACQYCGEWPCWMGCDESNDTRGMESEGYDFDNRGPL